MFHEQLPDTSVPITFLLLVILEPGSSEILPVAFLYSRPGHEFQSYCQNVGQAPSASGASVHSIRLCNHQSGNNYDPDPRLVFKLRCE